jgi:hypothetical protein
MDFLRFANKPAPPITNNPIKVVGSGIDLEAGSQGSTAVDPYTILLLLTNSMTNITAIIFTRKINGFDATINCFDRRIKLFAHRSNP